MYCIAMESTRLVVVFRKRTVFPKAHKIPPFCGVPSLSATFKHFFLACLRAWALELP